MLTATHSSVMVDTQSYLRYEDKGLIPEDVTLVCIHRMLKVALGELCSWYKELLIFLFPSLVIENSLAVVNAQRLQTLSQYLLE